MERKALHARVIPSPEVIQPRFIIPFLAAEGHETGLDYFLAPKFRFDPGEVHEP